MSLLDLDWQAQAVAGTAVWVAVGFAVREAISRSDERKSTQTSDAKAKVHSR
jgi:hypothetical protein